MRTDDETPRPTGTSVLGTTALAGILTAVVLAVGVGVVGAFAPVPAGDLADPVLVDEDPGLPSDEEPSSGWPDTDGADDDTSVTPQQAPDDTTTGDEGPAGTRPDTATGDDGTAPADGVVEDVTDTVDDVLDEATELLEGVTDDATEVVDDATEVVDDAAETVDEVLDDATEAVLP